MPTTTPSNLLTTSAAARILDLTSESVRQYERQGKLPAIRTESGMRLFQRADVERFAKARAARRAQATKG